MTRRSRWLAPLALSSVIVLAGCGGGGSSTSTTPFTLTSATAVLGQTGFTTAAANKGAAADATTVSQPLNATSAGNGTFFLADYSNNRILGYNSLPTVTNTPANFVLGQTDFTGQSLGNPPSQTNLAFPSSAWVGDSNGTSKLVVADTGNNRVLIWNTVPTANTPPDVVVGQADFTSFGNGLSASTLSTPVAAAIARNRLFVVDQGNSRVLIWNTVPTTNGTPADVVLGQPDFVTNTTTTVAQNRMNSPAGIWTDGIRLLVSDTGNSRVLYWTNIPSTIGANANFVIGQSSFTFSTTVTGSQTMNTPLGITSDGTRLFVADSRNNRVLVFNSFPLSNGVPADEVLGQENFTRSAVNDDNGNASDPQDGVSEAAPTGRTLSRPSSVYYAGGNVYVSDTGNNRILIFSGSNIPVPGNS